MIVKCSWCEKQIGESAPYDDDRISHGICKSCANKQHIFLMVHTFLQERGCKIEWDELHSRIDLAMSVEHVQEEIASVIADYVFPN